MKYSAVLLIFTSCLAWSQWNIKPQVGAGLTDNANYDENDKKSDFFWWLGGFGYYETPEAQWSTYLNFRDYLSEDHNDRLSYRVSRTHTVQYPWSGKLDWQWALGGQQYSGKSPAETEDSFNHIYVDTSLAKQYSVRSNFLLSYGPGAQIKSFTDFDGRLDFSLYGELNADWEFRSDQSLHPFAELGFVISNESEYSNTFIDLGADWIYEPHPKWRYLAGATLRQTYYMDRSISEAIAITNRKGKVISSTQSEDEAHTLFQLQGSATYLMKREELKSTIILGHQNSRSGALDFTEFQVQFAYITSF